MQEEKLLMFHNRLQKVYRHLGRQARRQNVSCYRVYDHDLPEFPFCIEIYEDKLYVAEYRRRFPMTEEMHGVWMQDCVRTMSETFRIPSQSIFTRTRQKKAGRQAQYQKLQEQQREFIVHEGGLKFVVNLSDYLDTGLFLDHRITRNKLKGEAGNKKVLNLFCYTGSFSVYAASGRADEIVSVDLSKTYLTWAEKNMRLNGFSDETKYSYVHADVKQYLKTVPEGHFDLVIMDPPTFSNSQRMEGFLDVQRDHSSLINDSLAGIRPGGVLYFSTNLRGFTLEKEKIRSSSIEDITKATTPFDFEGKLYRYCFRIKK